MRNACIWGKKMKWNEKKNRQLSTYSSQTYIYNRYGKPIKFYLPSFSAFSDFHSLFECWMLWDELKCFRSRSPDASTPFPFPSFWQDIKGTVQNKMKFTNKMKLFLKIGWRGFVVMMVAVEVVIFCLFVCLLVVMVVVVVSYTFFWIFSNSLFRVSSARKTKIQIKFHQFTIFRLIWINFLVWC